MLLRKDADAAALSPAEFRRLVGGFMAEVARLAEENAALRDEVARLVAPLPTGIQGHFGPELHRFVLLQHHQGQVTTERITAFLNGLAVAISKRQVVRLLTAKSTAFVDEAKAVLWAGLDMAAWISVDDTGARHQAKNGVTTQIGLHVGCGVPTAPHGDRLAFFATSLSKSRRNFLGILRAGHDDYVLNAAAFAYMHEHDLAGPMIHQLIAHPLERFPDQAAWLAHLDGLGIAQLRVSPTLVKIATEGALWASIRQHGLLQNTVIVSDDAGQFRIGSHALCWIHAERLVHKLIPFNDRQRQAVELVRQLIWWFPPHRIGPISGSTSATLAADDEPSCAPASIASSGAAPASSPSTACWPASTPAPHHHGPSSSGSSTGPRSRSIPTARRTTSAAPPWVALPQRCSSARSPNGRFLAAPGATLAATPATPASVSSRPARSPASRSSTISAPGSAFPTPRSSCRYQSWSAPALPPDRPAFCPAYGMMVSGAELRAAIEI